MNNENLIEEEKTYLIRRGLFHVQNEVGLGKSEEAYHQAFKLWLKQAGIPFTSKPCYPLMVDNVKVHELIPDFILWDRIPVELKSLPRRFRDKDWVQIHNYLKLLDCKIGLLVNMGLHRVIAERIIRKNDTPEFQQNWECWKNPTSTMTCLKEVIDKHFSDHLTGYGSEIVNKLFLHRLKADGLCVVARPCVSTTYEGIRLGTSELDCQVVNSEIVVCMTSLFEDNDFNRRRAKSFMKDLGLPHALAINSGKKTFQAHAL